GTVAQWNNVNLTVEARTAANGGGTLVTGYQGRIQLGASNNSLWSWGGGADSAARHTFTAADAGTHTFPISFNVAGPATVTGTGARPPPRPRTPPRAPPRRAAPAKRPPPRGGAGGGRRRAGGVSGPPGHPLRPPQQRHGAGADVAAAGLGAHGHGQRRRGHTSA